MARDNAPFSPKLSGMKITPLRHKLAEIREIAWYYRPIVDHTHSHICRCLTKIVSMRSCYKQSIKCIGRDSGPWGI